MTRCSVVVVMLFLGSVTAQAQGQTAQAQSQTASDSRDTCSPQPECKAIYPILAPGPAGPTGDLGIFTRSPWGGPPTANAPPPGGRVDTSNTRPGQTR
jgi:hypothetical protein